MCNVEFQWPSVHVDGACRYDMNVGRSFSFFKKNKNQNWKKWLTQYLYIILFQLLLYTFKTTSAYPNVGRHDSEKFYFDPKSKSKRLFPEYTEHSTLDLTVVVPAYNEEKRCKYPVGMKVSGCFLSDFSRP